MTQHIENLYSKIKIIFPEGYTEGESKTKEWLQVRVELPDGKLYELSIQASFGLQQQIERALKNQACYTEPNLVVVSELTIENVKNAVTYLYENDMLKNFSDYKSRW